MTTHCQTIRENLSLFLLGELDPQEFAAIDRHLEACAACESEVDAIRAVLAALPPDSFGTGTPKKTLEDQQAAPPLEAPGLSFGQPGRRLRAAIGRRVASLILVFLAGVSAGWTLKSGRSTPADSERSTLDSSEDRQRRAADAETPGEPTPLAQWTPERVVRGVSTENGLARVLLVMSAVAEDSE